MKFSQVSVFGWVGRAFVGFCFKLISGERHIRQYFPILKIMIWISLREIVFILHGVGLSLVSKDSAWSHI